MDQSKLCYDIYLSIFTFVQEVKTLFSLRESCHCFYDITSNRLFTFCANAMLFLIQHKAKILRKFTIDGVCGEMVSYQPGLVDVFRFGVKKDGVHYFKLSSIPNEKYDIKCSDLYTYNVKNQSIEFRNVYYQSNALDNVPKKFVPFSHFISLPTNIYTFYCSFPKSYKIIDKSKQIDLTITNLEEYNPHFCRVIYYQTDEIRFVLFNATCQMYFCVLNMKNLEIKIYEIINFPSTCRIIEMEHFCSIKTLNEYNVIIMPYLYDHNDVLYQCSTIPTKSSCNVHLSICDLENNKIVFTKFF